MEGFIMKRKLIWIRTESKEHTKKSEHRVVLIKSQLYKEPILSFGDNRTEILEVWISGSHSSN
jgi:hypothetical protein